MSERTWRIVTPEAVALDLEAAGLASRVLAEVIDLVVLQVVASALSTVAALIAQVVGADSVVVVVLIVVSSFLLILAWPVAWEVGTHGRSVGKMAVGLRVVTVEGAPIRFRHALVRGLVGLVELYLTLGTVALLVAMGSRRFRRLGDHLAGTVVIRERSGTASAQATRFLPQPGWESFADRLDVTRLQPEQYRLVRSYVLRASDLAFVTRWRIGNEILDVVAAATAMPPDLRSSLRHHEPALALTAVAAAYQRRFSPDPVFPPWLVPMGAYAPPGPYPPGPYPPGAYPPGPYPPGPYPPGPYPPGQPTQGPPGG